MKLEIYRVTYSYLVPGDRANNRQKENYFVVAESSNEANTKVWAQFQKSPTYTSLELTPADVRRKVTKMQGYAIEMPVLSLAADEIYQIRARISADGKNLEFIVEEKD